MIRPATCADLPALLRMLGDFAAASEAGRLIGGAPCPRHAGAFLERLIADARGLALILEAERGTGMLLAGVAPSPFRPVLVAEEIAFWIDPAARGPWAGAMLDAFEAWARASGAHLAGLAALEPRAGRLYARRGFAPVETTFGKVL